MRAERRFAAMGSTAHVVVVDGEPDAIDTAEEIIAALERRWSRFRADSDVSRLNRATGDAVSVHPDTVDLVETAVAAWAATGGVFDPTVHDAVVAAGYDRSFEALPAARTAVTTTRPAPGCAGIDIDRTTATIRLPARVRLDPGGIGKGLAVDRAVEALRPRAAGVCVNLGGDLRVTGRAPEGDAWRVAVEEVDGLVLALREAAVATSATTRRIWRVDGRARHHVIDPGTGRVADTAFRAATIVTGSCWWAEAAATAALLAPDAAAARQRLGHLTVSVLLVGHDGTAHPLGALEQSWIPTPGGTSPARAASSPGH